jgi:predicted DsbA family dithiol-disulfide isomerase
LEKLKEQYNARIVWHSYELRPADSPPISAAYRAQIEAKRPQMQQMAKEHYGLDINSGPFGIDSRPALIGAKYAEDKGVSSQYHDAVFRAYWQQARNIEEPEVLADIAEGCDLDRSEFLEALTMPRFINEVNMDIGQAFQYGLSGVPALVFNMKYLVMGAQPYDTLAEVAEKVLLDAEEVS